MTRMRLSLVTLGDPNRQTGGYLYHRRLADAAPAHDVEFRFVSFPERSFLRTLAAARKLENEVSAADVVVIDSIATAFAAPWLGRIDRPLAGMLHQSAGGIDHGRARRALQSLLDRRAYRHMGVLLVASESLADELRRVHPRVHVVPPGRDVSATIQEAPTDLRRGRVAAFLCVANWVPRKGILELLDAFARLPGHLATLHLAGDDAADARYSARVRKRLAPLAERVVVHGIVPKDRVAALYRDADVFVMPSYREPYGTVYGEAMAMGLPVVGWRAGNLPYLARDGVEGICVAPGDVSALAGALQRLAEDPPFRKRLGAAARIKAESFPTWEETAAAFFGSLRALSAG